MEAAESSGLASGELPSCLRNGCDLLQGMIGRREFEYAAQQFPTEHNRHLSEQRARLASVRAAASCLQHFVLPAGWQP